MIQLFRQPKENEQFVVGSDPSEGGDNSTFVVLSKFSADVVMVGKSKEESSQLGHTLNHVGRWFEKKTHLFPSIGVEKNVGSATIYVLKTLNYPNIFRTPDSFTKDDLEQGQQYGWSTNMSSRPKMLDDLALAIRQRSIRIPSKLIIDELYTFIRNEKTGKPEADRSSHDDLVIALSIAFQMFQIVPKDTGDNDILDFELLQEQEEAKFKGGFY